METASPAGTLFGMSATDFGTLLAAMATLAMLFVLYTVMTVRDPMAKRVKALNERREQLKAGITASTARRRAKLVKKNQTTDQMRAFLSSLKVLQDDQLKDSQMKLAQAGIRSKDLAVAVIFGRMVLPIVIGGLAALLLYGVGIYPDWGGAKRFMAFAVHLHRQQDPEALRRHPQGPARRARPAGDLRRGWLDGRCRLQPRRQGIGQGLS